MHFNTRILMIILCIRCVKWKQFGKLYKISANDVFLMKLRLYDQWN